MLSDLKLRYGPNTVFDVTDVSFTNGTPNLIEYIPNPEEQPYLRANVIFSHALLTPEGALKFSLTYKGQTPHSLTPGQDPHQCVVNYGDGNSDTINLSGYAPHQAFGFVFPQFIVPNLHALAFPALGTPILRQR